MPSEQAEARRVAARKALEDRIERGYTGAVSVGEEFTVNIINEFEAAVRAEVQ